MSVEEQIAKTLVEKGLPSWTEIFAQCEEVGTDGRKIVRLETLAEYFGVDAKEWWNAIQNTPTTAKSEGIENENLKDTHL